MIEEVDELRRAMREESAMLNWLIRQSDPIELFGTKGIGDYWTDEDFELNWRMAIRKAMGKEAMKKTDRPPWAED